MTTNQYILIALGTGVIAGALASQIITEKVMERKFEKQIEEERKQIKEYYKDKYGTHCISESGKAVNVDTDTPNPGESKFSKASIDYHPVDTHKVNYSTSRLGDNEEHTFSDVPIKHKGDIYVCTFEESCNAPEGYNEIQLKYFSIDGVLTDENGAPVDETIVGDGLYHFGDDPDDPDVVYVKNEKLKAVYCIVAIDAAYAPIPNETERRGKRGDRYGGE